MSFDLIDQETISKLQRLSSLDAVYGVKVNELSVEELFALYEKTGFLYPEKAARLVPHLGLVQENWRRLLKAGDSLIYVLTAGDMEHGRASIAVWRTTRNGWTSQHLVSDNNPAASRAVILAGSAGSILKGVDESHQNWFRPENRFPARVFGSMVQTIGDSLSSVQRHTFFAVSRHLQLPEDDRIRVVPYTPAQHGALNAIASLSRGSIYITAEELATDVELKGVDELYRQVGLRRYRQVWLAYRYQKEEPIGAVIAYRGPLGTNLSYIENRCDLLVHPTLPESHVGSLVSMLLKKSASAYADFELEEIPVIADQIAAPALMELGAQFLRHYCQGIWLQEGQSRFYRHVDSFYTKLMQRMERHTAQPSLVGQQ